MIKAMPTVPLSPSDRSNVIISPSQYGNVSIMKVYRLQRTSRLVADYTMSHASSAAWQNLLHATLADRLKLLIDIFSSTNSSANVSEPLAIAPTNTQMLSSDPKLSTYSLTLTTGASKLSVTLRQFGGR